ncbi:S-adenosyl-L-methionine-dependent methyltransferase [Phyllosticta citrichinensis]|uniref:NOL1/NOP2/Sun domain family member 4 n=1 Tax=Phyllosticta citrichinensis TaxID=1130410 RepID=A0ABR1Y4Q6_9PEZI
MPTKAERKQLDATIAAFHTHYAAPANGWGHERWHDSLYPALTKPTRYAALVNQFVPRADVEKALVAEVPEDELRVIELPALHDDEDDEGKSEGPKIVLYERVLAATRRGGEEEGDGDEEGKGEGKEEGMGEGEGTGKGKAKGKEAAEKQLPFPPPKSTTVHSPPQSSQQLLTHWNMDAASALAAHMLDVRPGDKVLDLCSAPGGKSVALSQIIFANKHHDQQRQQSTTTIDTGSPGGCLHTNEPDPARAKRLLANLRCYLPSTLFAPPAKAVQTFTLDASVAPRFLAALPHGAAGYDRVLLDAPCSSERHVIQAHERAAAAAGRVADDMARWRPGASRALQKTQARLLVTALRAVRTGGRVLYSTCSVERGENDGVVERVKEVLKKERRKGSVWVRGWDVRVEMGQKGERGGGGDRQREAWERVETRLELWAEETDYGRITVPDVGEGRWGPLFFCVLTKVERTDK